MRLAIMWIFGAMALLGGFAVVGGFLGAFHPAGDSLAVFRLPLAGVAIAAALVAAALARGGRRWMLAGAGALGLAATPAALSYAEIGRAEAVPEAALTIYQKNLLWLLDDPAPLIADIRASGADIVTFQEVNEENLAVLSALEEIYPAQAWCSFRRVGGTAVLSRWPAAGEAVCTGGGMTALPLEAPGGRLWAVSVHLHWPWPHGQAPHARRIAATLEELEGPVVMGGDFNMVPWGASVRRLARAARVEKAGPTATTFTLFGGWVRLPIDHVFLPHGWRGSQEVRPRLGSDHLGVVVRASR